MEQIVISRSAMHERGGEIASFKPQVKGRRIHKKSEVGVLAEIQNSEGFKLGSERFPQILEQNLKNSSSSRSFADKKHGNGIDSCLTPVTITEVSNKLINYDSLRKNSNFGKLNPARNPANDVETA